jgi:hypothetical protein
MQNTAQALSAGLLRIGGSEATPAAGGPPRYVAAGVAMILAGVTSALLYKTIVEVTDGIALVTGSMYLPCVVRAGRAWPAA